MRKRSCEAWHIFTCLIFISICFACKPVGEQNSSVAGASNKKSSLSRSARHQNTQDTVRLKIPNYPLRNEQDLNILIEQIGDARVVLLGEATHGTHEFYTWRTAISKRLMEEKGFDFIAVEGEWADSYRVNNFTKGKPQDSAAVVALLREYDRWPTWMWGNYEVASLITWLNQHNQSKPDNEKKGFFGLDVYCLWESMNEVIPYLEGAGTAVIKSANKVQDCFKPYSADAQHYALAVANLEDDCRAETNRFWKTVQQFTGNKPTKSEADFVVEQNALVAYNGERYYRAMVEDGASSWNIRDNHMTETLMRLLNFHGAGSKSIVWEHNTHVGDARYTDMAKRGEVNVGQLVRKALGEDNVFVVGFGTYEGTVIAADAWGQPYREMNVPKAEPGSWEAILHQLNGNDKIIFSKDIMENPFFLKPIGNRAIGVVYNPDMIQIYQFVPSVMPKRYDAFLFIDHTRALRPIPIQVRNEPPDLYPSGK